MPVKIIRVKAPEVSRYWVCPKCGKGGWLAKPAPVTSIQPCAKCLVPKRPWAYKEV